MGTKCHIERFSSFATFQPVGIVWKTIAPHVVYPQLLHLGFETAPFIQPIYDLTTTTMSHARIAIIGDAAFTARPHLGVGITKTAEDGLALADALETHGDVSMALQQFNAERSPVNRNWVNRSRELGAYLQAQRLNETERQHAQLHRTTDAVMRETASLLP